MTVAPDRTQGSQPPSRDVRIELPVSGSGARAHRRRKEASRHRRNRILFGVTLGVLAAIIPILAFIGFRTVADSRSGRLVDTSTGPSDPGYEAIVTRTPVALLAQVELPDDGPRRLVSLTVLSLGPGGQGGAVLFVPVAMAVDTAGMSTMLAASYETGGLDGLRAAVALVVGTSFEEAFEADGAFLAQITAPVTPLEVQNPDDVVVVGTDVSFEGGPLSLADVDVAAYLAARGEQESDLARLVRHEVLWSAWLAAVTASNDPAAVPGETATGLGRFVRGLAAGGARFETLPIDSIEDGDGNELFRVDAVAAADLMSELVPFPTSPAPGLRPRVRLLNGVAGPQPGRDAAIQALVRAGAEIDSVGNADRFDHAATTIIYYDPNRREDAMRFRDALGTGTVMLDEVAADVADVTVVLGADYLEEDPPA